MENSPTDFQQPETVTAKRIGSVFNWAIIKSHKILTVVFLILSAGIALSALILLEPCHGDGIGCLVLVPFYIASLPVLPIFWLISEIIDKITLPYSSFYGMSSILKFIPIFILSTAAFFVGYIVTHIILRLRKNKIGPENYITGVRLARKNFIFYNAVFILLFSSYIFIQSPPAPLASGATIIKNCDSYEQCYQSYIRSKVESCDGEKTMFVYPLKTTPTTVDWCAFESFSKKRLFKNITISQGSGGVTIITSGKSGTTVSSPTYQMDILLKIFHNQLEEANATQKESFCDAFSNDIRKGYVSGDISNKEYCVLKLGLVPSNENNLVNLCTNALTRENWTQSDLQNKCLSKFVNFQTYDPNVSIYDEFFGEGWQYISFQPGGAVYDNLQMDNKNTLGIVYKLNVRKRYAGLGEFDDLRISQGATDGPFYEEYADLNTPRKKIEQFGGGQEERVGVTDEVIRDTKVLIEHRVEHRNTGDRFYDIFHFVKNGTYIQLNGEFIYYLGDTKKDLMFRKITEDILSR